MPKTESRSESAQRFRKLVHEAVTPEDVQAICRMLAEDARQGNVIAAKLLFNYLGGTPGVLPATPDSDGGGVHIYLPAIDDSTPHSQPASSLPASEPPTDISEPP